MLLFFLNSDSFQAKPSSSSSTISSTIVTGTAVFKRWLIWPIFTELIKRMLKRDEWYWEKQMHEICVTTIWRLELQVEAPWPSPAASNAFLWSWMDKATLLRKAFTMDSMISFHMQLLPPLGALVFFEGHFRHFSKILICTLELYPGLFATA